MHEKNPPGNLGQPSVPAGVRTITAEQVDAGLIDAWRRLTERALEPNAYLTPMFVLPALSHIDPGQEVKIVLIEDAGGELIGLGVFATRRLVPLLDLHSLKAYRSRHSYLTGLLIDPSCATVAVDAFFGFLSRPGSRWHGVRFDWLGTSDAFSKLLFASADKAGVRWFESERLSRAILIRPTMGKAAMIDRLPSALLKNLRRCQRRLAERGRVEWQLHLGRTLPDRAIECFLELEHMGWKGKAGTSIRARAAHERFFWEMIEKFRARAEVFFTELRLDDQVIASTCNLISGGRGFAFKIGWHTDYAPFSPGMLNELAMLENFHALAPHIDQIDSGAVQGSYIDKLWLDRQELVSGVFATTPTGRLFFWLAPTLRNLRLAARELSQRLRNRLGRRWPWPSGEPVKDG